MHCADGAAGKMRGDDEPKQQVMPLFTAQTSSFTVALTGNGTVTSTSTPTVTPEINCANPRRPARARRSLRLGRR